MKHHFLRAFPFWFLVFFLMSASEMVYAVDPSQLWLPRNYNRYMNELKEAVDVAEATERCVNVIAGTVSTKDSIKTHPVFKVTCRDENRKTFPWLVDSKSMKIINFPKDNTDVSGVDAEDSLTEEERAVFAFQKNIWSVCAYRIGKRTKNLHGLTIDLKEIPEPKIMDEEELAFEIVFTAKVMMRQGESDGQTSEIEQPKENQHLSYTAFCRYQHQHSSYDLQIIPTERISQAIASKKQSVKKESDHKNRENNTKSMKNLGHSTVQTASDNKNLRASDERESVAYESCIKQLTKKTAALDNVVWMTDKEDLITSSNQKGAEGNVVKVDFDADGPTGKQLHSTGVCRFNGGNLVVEIKQRKN